MPNNEIISVCKRIIENKMDVAAGGQLSGTLSRKEHVCITGGASSFPELGDPMTSLCWYPWYPNRWFGSIGSRTMTLEEKGAYRELLDWQWQGCGYLPKDLECISRVVGFDVGKYPNVVAKFPIVGDKRANPVLLEIWEDQSKKHQKYVNNANKRWKKEDTDTDTEDNAHAKDDASHNAKHDALHNNEHRVLDVSLIDKDFLTFWETYPRKVGKKAALKAWNKANDKPELSAILAAIKNQANSPNWKKDGGKFIPHPATWLNQGRWDDVVTFQRPKESAI